MSVCTCTQNPASQYVEMDLWKLESNVTVATVTSAVTPAAIMPMMRRTKGANFSPANCAGQKSRFLPSCLEFAVGSIESVVDLLSGLYPAVQAKDRAAQDSAPLRARVIAADRTLNVPRRGCATVSQPSVPLRSPRKTSPPATKKHKCASAGYV